MYRKISSSKDPAHPVNPITHRVKLSKGSSIPGLRGCFLMLQLPVSEDSRRTVLIASLNVYIQSEGEKTSTP